MGGSTNAVLHLLAIAHSGKINLTIDDFETISSGIQHLVAMIPAGKYTLFDFFEAGGVQALMKEMEEKLYVDALTCTGDMISVDVENGKIDAIDVDFEERRKKKYICHQKVEGYLYQYAKNVTSASKGAVIPTYENE